MDDLLTLLGGGGPFIPHGHCYLWKPELVYLHLVSDALIAAAYYSIPITLLYFIRKRKDLPFHKIFLLFAAFIVSCGTTHLAAIWTLWYPTYWLSGAIKAFTALISVFTALELIPLVPLALALPSPAQLETVNQNLQAQIKERLQVEEVLRQSQNLLEQRVEERTKELAQANQQLQQEVQERQRTEEALRRSETVLNAFLASSPVGMAFLDQDLRYVHINEALAVSNGLPLEVHQGRTPAEVLPQWADQLMPVLQQVLETREPLLNQEISGETNPAGVYRCVLVSYFPVCLTDGEVLGVGVTCMDITSLKRTEAALRASELIATARAEELEIIMETVPAAVWVAYDARCEHMTANRTAYELMRMPPGTMDGTSYSTRNFQLPFQMHQNGQLIPYEKLPMQRAGLTGEAVEEEFELVFGEGDVRSLYGKAVPLWDEKGEVRGVIGAFLDVTERNRTEAALRQSEERLKRANERFQLAARAVSALIYDWNVPENRVERTDGLVHVTGYTPEEVGDSAAWWSDRIHPEDLQRMLESSRELFQHDYYSQEYRVLNRNNEYVHVLDQGLVAERDAAGNPIRIVGSTINISDRKAAEALIQASEAKLRSFVEADVIGVLFADIHGHIHEANDEFLRIIGYSQTDLRAGKLHWPDLTPPEYLSLDYERIAEAQEKGACTPYEKEYIRRDGSRISVLVGFSLIEPVREEAVAFIIDLTEQKQAEAERDRLLALEKKARTEAERANRIKDEFLAVLSHELRSPLNPILGWATLLKRRQVDAVTLERALDTIERNIKLQLQLIDDLLDVSRILRGKLSINMEAVDLRTAMLGALETVRLSAEAKSIQIHTRFAESVDPVRGDTARLQQIVWNLLSNSVKFTPAGGQIEMSLDQVDDQVQIQVKDTGKGISPDFLPHVFEYFRQEDGSTTRQFGGLGLGLAIVRYLTEMHGGTVMVESPGEGLGSTFTVHIPRMIVPQGADSQASPALSDLLTPLALKDIRILVAEDEADTRDFITFMLEQTGADVTAVPSAKAALAFLEQTIPDILISDIGMPDMDGYMLIRAVRSRSPERGGYLPAIALTAYAGEQDHQRAYEAGFHLHVAKPVDSDRLIELILSLVKKSA
ncbi:MAG TPA: PAS domain S-box protein [Leptolyngbyaceae cyanobacterium]